MKPTAIIAAMTVALATPAAAQPLERMPQKFIGLWCAAVPDGSSYKRTQRCDWAEDSVMIDRDSMLVAGEIECELLETRPKPKFRCRHFEEKETWEKEYRTIAIERGRLIISTRNGGRSLLLRPARRHTLGAT